MYDSVLSFALNNFAASFHPTSRVTRNASGSHLSLLDMKTLLVPISIWVADLEYFKVSQPLESYSCKLADPVVSQPV